MDKPLPEGRGTFLYVDKGVHGIGQSQPAVYLLVKKRRERWEMYFTCTEIEGIQPFSQWLIGRAEKWMRERYGLEVRVSLNPKYHHQNRPKDHPGDDSQGELHRQLQGCVQGQSPDPSASAPGGRK